MHRLVDCDLLVHTCLWSTISFFAMNHFRLVNIIEIVNFYFATYFLFHLSCCNQFSFNHSVSPSPTSNSMGHLMMMMLMISQTLQNRERKKFFFFLRKFSNELGLSSSRSLTPDRSIYSGYWTWGQVLSNFFHPNKKKKKKDTCIFSE